MYKIVKLSILIVVSIVYINFILPSYLFAQGNANNNAGRDCSSNPYAEPSCPEGIRIKINADCQTKKILNPSSAEARTCCLLICENNRQQLSDEGLGRFVNLNIFNTKFRLDLTDSRTVEFLISLFVSTILGIVSLYALFKGTYLLAFVRPNLTKSDDIKKLNQKITALVAGFTLAWGAIFIIQLTFNFLGLGDITDFSLFEEEEATVITIRSR
ncbi:MAG: hypothetical protein NZZ41_01560 [Candidatus Dojkabacteria bacterium]|nr:hypothetical protein [Candidatus Dojkabacteria bacterium]